MTNREFVRFHELIPFMTSLGAYASQFGFTILTSYACDEVDQSFEIYVNLELKFPAVTKCRRFKYRPDPHLPLRTEKHQLKLMIAEHFKQILNQQLKPIYDFPEEYK